jgi:hypothetical protein
MIDVTKEIKKYLNFRRKFFNLELSLEFCDEGLKYKKISYLGEES